MIPHDFLIDCCRILQTCLPLFPLTPQAMSKNPQSQLSLVWCLQTSINTCVTINQERVDLLSIGHNSPAMLPGGGYIKQGMDAYKKATAYQCCRTDQRRGCKEENGENLWESNLKIQLGSGKDRLMKEIAIEAWRQQQRECRNPPTPNTQGCVSEIYSSGFGSIFPEYVYMCLLPSALQWV